MSTIASIGSIRNFWEPILLKLGKINGPIGKNQCFACGLYFPSLEKAHIYPKRNNGKNGRANIHLLCKYCHDSSESIINLREYWIWFMNRTPEDCIWEQSLIIKRSRFRRIIKPSELRLIDFQLTLGGYDEEVNLYQTAI